jgi:hypothetical protein
MMYAILLLALFVAQVTARCDNGCSGHGKCSTDDVCVCFDNWGVGMSGDSGDCSERVCPFELAWVDSPDGSGRFHKYVECAGKGICDRDSGECECFTGYEGKGCQRTSCPNDCSGHGTCEYIEDILPTGHHNFITTTGNNTDGGATDYPGSGTGATTKFGQDWLAAERYRGAYHGWDKHKVRGCICDAQYHDSDCSKRMCPYGTDRLDRRLADNLLTSEKHQIQRLLFSPSNKTDVNSGGALDFNGITEGIEMLEGQTFAITFRSKLNETFTTIPIVMNLYDTIDLSNDIRLALLSLPNKVIDGVSVTSSLKDDVGMIVDVEFTGNGVQGAQHPVWVESYECSEGCTPKITGLDIITDVSVHVNYAGIDGGAGDGSGTGEHQLADQNSYECGRRGKCDYATGLCECFSGYTGENCNTQTVLV